MKSHTPSLHRPTTQRFSTRRRRYNYWPALALVLLAAVMVWAGAASASCNFLMTLASLGSADGQVLTPRGIATDSAGNVFVADQNDRVQKFNSSGVFQFKFATGGSSTGAVVAAFGVAVDKASGNIYVTDGFTERTSGIVQKFDSTGAFVTSWGTAPGSGNGQFITGAGGVGVDSAGKGGTIRRITERTSPRVFKHIALPAPDARTKSQMYIQRYIAHFPSAGEVVIFDRSWYNRAGVEPVMGYCSTEDTRRFLELVPFVEKAMVHDGIILIKYFLNVSSEEQTRRLESRIDDPRKVWKLSPTDLKSYRRRFDYLRARDTMIAATSSTWAPWHIVDNDDKKRGRLNIITHLLGQIPYEPLAPLDATMPEPPHDGGYAEPESSRPNIPAPF